MINETLNKYLNNEKTGNFTSYTLDGIKDLLNYLNNPHKNFKTVHIAGTNGKGSTAFMLSSILQRSGYKTGLYTSPHLVTINERIKINLKDINDSLLYMYLTRIDSVVDNKKLNPTYFDVLTAAAFCYFDDEKVDIAIIETGLGGRLDSTNVIDPEVAVLTDISIDHTNVLGETIRDITIEKCGIIKKNTPVITSNDDSEISDIIKLYSEKNSADLYSYHKNFYACNICRKNNNFIFDYVSDEKTLNEISIPLFPQHQIKNTALVITTLLHLKTNGFNNITDIVILNELKNIYIPGRFRILSSKPLVIYDPAHNYNALKNLMDGLDEFYPEKNKTYFISMMKDKVNRKTIDLFKSKDSRFYILNDVRAFIPEEGEFELITSDKIIIDIFQKADNHKMFIFTGTFRIYNNAVNIINEYKKIFQDQL